MAINIDRVLDKLMYETDLNNLKWRCMQNSPDYTTFITEIKITKEKEIRFKFYKYVKTPRLTNLMIHFSPKEDRQIFVHTIVFQDSSKKMVLLGESLDRKLKRGEIKMVI